MKTMATPDHAYGVEFSGGRASVMLVRRRASGAGDVLAMNMDVASDPAWPVLTARMALDQRRGAAVVSAVARAQECFVRPVEAPFDSIVKARAVMPSLLDVQLPFPVEQCMYDFVHCEAKPDGNGTRAVAVAMPHDRLRALLSETAEAGLDPEMIEAEALALWREARRHQEPMGGAVLVVIHLAADRTVLVFGRDDFPVSSFSARTAWNPVADSAAAEKMCARIRQFLAGHIREEESRAVRYMVAGIPKHADALRSMLGVDAAAWRVMDQPETVLVRSLAASALQPDAWTSNLRAGSFEHPHIARDYRRARRKVSVWLMVASLLLAAVSLITAGAAALNKGAWERAVAEKAFAMTGFADILQARAKLATVSPAEEMLDQWIAPVAYPVFARVLVEAHQSGLNIETVSVRASGVLVRGDGSSWGDADRIAGLLREAGVTVDDKAIERRDAGSDERIHFSVRGAP